MKIISKNKNFMMNEEIRDKEIRVIAADGSALGILDTRDAIKLAEDSDLDLVMMSPTAKPPVCRIMDIGKFEYEKQKKEKEAKKKQKVVTLKEIRLSATIQDHDISIKASNAKKFLLDEDKVKITVRFRGREIENSKAGHKILRSFVEKIGDVYIVEKPARQEGRNMIMILAPKKA
ncbi:translation initiation factor IF-3 [Clostridium estertheticum]|uniref:Translation initiation factor IF-3 n=2 Tax=Clostridium estertheticum TaxID=238834 RepID=A0A1J0GJZ4_9CLOT|nr:translation initiation factor IF-3 [Clostridium estertheticum]APC41730.1 translation initiation factor IF-3 [Clostridium estertheticum subsp. estertheticum]MBU3073435.1 translation initiation factor IF-3 [Clostridium estertheticum]MBU3163324.1 translation initiation factor IF-3 [Clostridium estertheticum]MBU3171597.1 translation initiation factor IF-3 [Clostridium estertheticum]MBU3185432.1 translation initiation factor IF-3 [Clostridium estertheticum]